MNDAPLSGLSTIADRYDAILCDVWGVLHNGVTAHEGVAEALRRFRASGPVVLVTNAPRPSGPIAGELAALGVPDNAYDAVISSGDVVRRHLEEHGHRTVHHLGPSRDLSLYAAADIALTDEPTHADVTVVTGLRDDDTDRPADYRGELRDVLALGRPIVCANPDIVVERGGDLIYCAGALAAIYEELGGTALQFGKPHPPIYAAALDKVREQAPEARRVLAIGDGLPTDIRGAHNEGLDALFITGGIHAEELTSAGTPNREAIAARLARDGLAVAHYAQRLVW